MIFGRNKKKAENNRLKILMAVIFLLVFFAIVKLFNLQVMNNDKYLAWASRQHLVSNELQPDRGRIFIQNDKDFEGEQLYPIATNKEFAFVQSVPKDVDQPEEVSEKLYELFHQSDIEAEVERLLRNDDFFKNLEDLDEKEKNERLEFREIKKTLEIDLRREREIENYIRILTKKNDPWEPIRKKVEKEQLEELMAMNFKGLFYNMENHRYYPEGEMGAHIIGFVGYKEDEKSGRYGLEGFFNNDLFGQMGSIKAEKAAGSGGVVIINDREYHKPINGHDLILTINRSIQFEVCKRLSEAALSHGADGGTVVAMEPNTGAIIAMCSWPEYNPNNYNEVKDINVYNNPAIFDQYEPGSIFKPITIAAGIDRGEISPDTTYEDKGYIMIEGWPKAITNSDYSVVGGHGQSNMVDVLEKSLNTGAIFVMEKIGAKVFAEYVENFGFGERTGIELQTENRGNINNLKRKVIRPIEAATASYGQGISVTPLQIVSAFSAIANGGVLMKPYLVDEIVLPDGKRQKTQPKQIRRVVSERAALLATGIMVNVVDRGHAARAGVEGYYVGGKTGTAQVASKGGYSREKYIHSFVGFAPADNPKFVMLVKLDSPRSARFAVSTAAPLFGELADYILNYYQVPKER